MLKDNLPPLIRSMADLSELLDAETAELNHVQERITDIVKQFCIKTATWSLSDWEREFGLEDTSILTDDQRRAQLLGILNTRTPASVSMLENLVRQILSAKKVTIVEHPAEYRFDIYVLTDYLISNMLIADRAVRQARPAHLAYSFINGLKRSDRKTVYVGAGCKSKKKTEGEVNTDGLLIDG